MLSANGKLAALGVNIHDRNDNSREVGEVQLWDLAMGKEAVKIPMAGWATGVDFSPDAKVLATACGQKGLHLWDTATGTRLRVLEKAGCAMVAAGAVFAGRPAAGRGGWGCWR